MYTDKDIAKFWSKVEKTGGYWKWISPSTNGVGCGVIRLDRTRKQVLAHRVSFEIANGPISEGMEILHKCDNPGCVRPVHLFLGTQKDTAMDMSEKGRKWLQVDPSKSKMRGDSRWLRANPEKVAKGERSGSALLNGKKVGTIRREYFSGKTSYSKLAREYGISVMTIHLVVSGKTWKEGAYK